MIVMMCDVMGRPSPPSAQMFPDFTWFVKSFEHFINASSPPIIVGCAELWLYKTVWHEFCNGFLYCKQCRYLLNGLFYTPPLASL